LGRRSAGGLLVYGRAAGVPDGVAAPDAAELWRFECLAIAGTGDALCARRMDTGGGGNCGVFPAAGSARRGGDDIPEGGTVVPVFGRLIISAVYDALLGDLDLGRLCREAQTGDRRAGAGVRRDLRSRNDGGICMPGHGRVRQADASVFTLQGLRHPLGVSEKR
jgi:hypothetical protein